MDEEELIPVWVVKSRGKSSLVQYVIEGNKSKVFIDEEDLKVIDGKNFVSSSVLELAIPYGIPWDVLLDNIGISGEEIAQSLRNQDVFTVADYQRNPTKVQSAVASLYAKVFNEISSVVNNYQYQLKEAQNE